MLDTRIILSGLWVATMLSFLWGDVLSVLAGDATPGKMAGMQPTQGMWFGIAVVMLIPILMVVLSLTLKYDPRFYHDSTASFMNENRRCYILAASVFITHGVRNHTTLAVLCLYPLIVFLYWFDSVIPNTVSTTNRQIIPPVFSCRF